MSTATLTRRLAYTTLGAGAATLAMGGTANATPLDDIATTLGIAPPGSRDE